MPVGPWELVGWALIIGVAVIPPLVGIGIGVAIARALWIAATLGAIRSEGDPSEAQ